MKLENSTLVRYIGVFSFSVLSLICKKVCIFGWWVGSRSAGVGVRTLIQPLIGRYTTTKHYTISSIALLILALSSGYGSLLRSLTWVLPGIVAGYSLNLNSRYFTYVVCFAAMVFFCSHPEGLSAWAYCLYWLIPMALHILFSDTMVIRSVTASLIAHAVGSVLWLYGTDMSASLWLMLIPRVAVERALISMGLFVSQLCVEHCMKKLDQRDSKCSLALRTVS